MRIICVDDEELILNLTVSMCQELPQAPEVMGFSSAVDAINYIKETSYTTKNNSDNNSENNSIDIAILDINMQDVDGLALAANIKELQPDISIIFLTGYADYAVDAWQLHASGYLMKPVNKDKLLAEIEYAMKGHVTEKETPHIQALTFGKFNVLVDGRTVSFKRSKAKELLAYLVDRQGAQITRADAFTVLWVDGGIYDRSAQKQLDVIIRSLRDTLNEYGIPEILELERGTLHVVTSSFDCDLYNFLKGDMEAIRAYRGEYMEDYSWASFTEAYIDRISG